MSECYSKFFIRNTEVLREEVFQDSLVSTGTSLYEVIRVIDGVPLFLEKHLERLKNSAQIVNFHLWMDLNDIKEKLLELININNVLVGNVKIIFNYNNNEGKEKRTFLAYFIKHHYPSKELYENGVSTILCFMERDKPNAKIINNELRKITDEKMKSSGAYEAILVDKNENITEGSRSNIFMIKENVVLTAPIVDVLPGITRQIIMDICKAENIQIEEKRVSYKELKELSALFITGTSPKVLPVNKVENIMFNSSKNSIVLKIKEAYDKIIETYIVNNKIL
ncbi:aminotransferase class IV [Clostridium sp. SYSU_GA19001]|uniref:aminotransferase class IV n=1 Tax=Clostridium caldaquaticum TaxID=2940653 RepID=UPI002076D844|nr:aminotransferase class IV [Clostridium caldaquaticum]MCM8710940.1 aminotransferase class IV [Clostridium caldaquaticum]